MLKFNIYIFVHTHTHTKQEGHLFPSSLPSRSWSCRVLPAGHVRVLEFRVECIC